MDTEFKGNGPMKKFVTESVRVFSALENAIVKVPPGFIGVPPEFVLEETKDSASFKLEMNDAIMFNKNGVVIKFNGTQQPRSDFSMKVTNGRLRIRFV